MRNVSSMYTQGSIRFLNCAGLSRLGFVVFNLLYNVPPIVCGGSVFGPCYAIHYLMPILLLAIILTSKIELVASL